MAEVARELVPPGGTSPIVPAGRARAPSTSRPRPIRSTSSAPIFLGYFGYFFVYILTGISFLRERVGGTLERLLATPVTRGEIVLGYSLGFGIFATIQVILLADVFSSTRSRFRRSGRSRRSRSASASSRRARRCSPSLIALAALDRRGEPGHLPVDVRPDRAPDHPVHPARDRAPGTPERHALAGRAPAGRPPGDRPRAADDVRGRGRCAR